MRYFKKLVADTIYLSPMNPDDYEIYTKWLNDTSIGIYLGQASKVTSINKEKEIIEKLSKEGVNLAIINSENDTLMGNVSLMNIDNLNGKYFDEIYMEIERSNFKSTYLDSILP